MHSFIVAIKKMSPVSFNAFTFIAGAKNDQTIFIMVVANATVTNITGVLVFIDGVGLP